MDKRVLTKEAIMAALRVRLRAGLSLTDPANPIEIAEKMGVQVWFKRVKSLEGMLIRAPHPVIVLSSLRPSGRIAFSCAHELGHFSFQHDGHVDIAGEDPQLTENEADEFQANAFAAYLLMPKTLVQYAFAQRRIDLEGAEPREVLGVSQFLGVGYSTLIRHVRSELRLLSVPRAEVLLRKRPKDIVEAVSPGIDYEGSATLVDRAWRGRSVDLEVGDIALVDGECSVSGACVRPDGWSAGRRILAATCPGAAHISDDQGRVLPVRVRRARYEGRSIFRHMEDNDE